MSEQEMDKLVEEIKDRFCKVLCGGYNYGEKRCDCYPHETWGTAQAQCSRLNDTIDFAISLFVSAVHGGQLDGQLGVAGRHNLGWPSRYHEIAHDWIDDLPDESLELIALRPLPGTEEKA